MSESNHSDNLITFLPRLGDVMSREDERQVLKITVTDRDSYHFPLSESKLLLDQIYVSCLTVMREEREESKTNTD